MSLTGSGFQTLGGTPIPNHGPSTPPPGGGITVFISNIKRVENYSDFDKLANIIQHGLQGFIVRNIEGESTEANDLSLIL